MDAQPLVSVVIPAWNAEKTLKRALQSVLAQSWSALQVIVVDDGSSDCTLSIARNFEAEDPRVTVLSQPNAGVSSARNLGLSLCRGKYIRFVDGDDTLPSDSMERMVLKAELEGADLVIGGYTMYMGDIVRRKNLENREDTLPCDEMLRLLCPHSNSYFYGVLWNKLFSRERVESRGVHFMDGVTWGEDFAFVMDYLQGAGRVAFLKDYLYDYRRQPGSMTVTQVLDSIRHPIRNIRMKILLYRHLKDLYLARGQYGRYRSRLWMYLFRVGLD